ncbi:MAG: hypothetical protein KY433_07125 [Actinobacteria bacterium]|nr:hypothetical protein [Actinomycetota bacterium]
MAPGHAEEDRSALAARAGPPLLFVAWAALSILVLVALALWQGQSYWEYSDGVYALSARYVLDGRSPYSDFAAAQPPSLFYVGAAVLAIDDSATAVRVAMAVCKAAVSLLVLIAVWRLTRRRDAALLAALASLVTPWALREHAQLLPETLAAPLIMGAALAAGRRTTAALGGVLGAVAVTFKLALVLPALAIVLLGRHVRRGLVGFAAAGAVLAIAFLALFGTPLWTNVVRAQTQAGYASLQYVAGLWAQAGWNVLALLVLAALAWPQRDRLHDRDLARSLLAASVGSLLLLATLLKNGSYLTAMIVVEPPLVCLAACGVVSALRRQPGAPRTRARIVVALASALVAAQVGSLLVAPDDPALFTRPLSAAGPARTLSDAEVGAAARTIAACPPGSTYAGPPYLAFVAGRDVAGLQPDQFIIHAAPVLDRFRMRADADASICTDPRLPVIR